MIMIHNDNDNENKQTEPYVVIDNDIDNDINNDTDDNEFSELVFLDVGNYLNNLVD